jgi:hypothetical protein
MEFAGLGTGFSSTGASPATSAAGDNFIPAVSAFSNSWSVLKTCRRDEAISVADIDVKDT